MEFGEAVSLAFVAWTAVLLIVATYIYRLLTTKHDYFTRQGVSGPDPTLPTGSWRGAWKSNIGEEDLERTARYGKVHGTFNGASPNLIVGDPALIKKILHDDASHFRSRRAYRVKNEVLRNSLLSIEGNDSKELKHVLSSTFSTDKIKKLVPRINQSIDSLVNVINKEVKADKAVLINATQKVKDYLSDVLAFTILGVEFNSENNLKEQFLKIVEGAYFISNPQIGFAITPFVFDTLSTLDEFVLKKSSLKFLTILYKSTILTKKKQDADTSVAKAVDFLDLLLAAAEEEKKHSGKEKGDTEIEGSEILLNDDKIFTQIVSVMLSMIQVARSTLALSLHTLTKLPAVQDKLRLEITKELQTHHGFTYELVQSCEYLDMFLGEILRLYPLEYRLDRECANELKLGETTLEAGVLVSVPVYAIHRHKDFYPEPETFEPDRFSAENASKRDHYTYLPFGQAGANSTNVGIQLGVLITKLALAALINDFKWQSGDDSKIPAPFKNGITGVPCIQEIFVKAEVK